MIAKAWNYIKGVVNKLVQKQSIKHKLGIDIAISDEMQRQVSAWYNVFQNKPSWLKVKWKPLNLMAIATKEMATLCANELTIDIDGDKIKSEFILDQISRFVYPENKKNIQNCFIGGSCILKPFIDGKQIKSELVTAQSFYPVRYDVNGQLLEVIFTDIETVGDKTYIKLEHQNLEEDGVMVTNKAFEYNGEFGKPIPLLMVKRWANVEPEIKINNVDRLLFAYFKTSDVNNVDGTKTPISICSNAMAIMEELDRIYNEYLYEIHTGKRRMIVDATALQRDASGNPIYPSDIEYDAVFLELDLDEKILFQDYTPEIRTEAYQKAIDIQLRLFEIKTGFSSGSFNFDIKSGRVTATQIISEDKTTYNTCKDLQECNRQAYIDLVYVYSVLCDLYSLTPKGAVKATIGFGDSIFEDTATEYIRRKQMVDSGILRPELLLAWYFNTSEDKAMEMLPDTTNKEEDTFQLKLD